MKRILVALDSTPEASSVLQGAVDLAKKLDAKITLLRVVRPLAELPPPSSLLLRVPSTPEDLVRVARQQLALLADDVPASMREGAVVETGNAASRICEVAERVNADLVVIGAHQHGVLRQALGTTAARVVNAIERPVLVLRPVVETERGIDPAAGDGDVLPGRSPADLLRESHHRLDGIYQGLVDSYREGDWDDVRVQWDVFEPELRAHMQFEEDALLGAFRAANAEEAERLVVEHEELRTSLADMAVAIDLRVVPSDAIDALVARLRAHAAREERLFYPWLDRRGASACATPAVPPVSLTA